MPFAFDFFDTQFSRCFSPSTWTLPSHASLFSGDNPIEHGITRKNHSLESRHVKLPSAAKEAGYTTALFSENPFFSSYRGFNNGIEFIDDQINYKLKYSDFSIANHADDPTTAAKKTLSNLLVSDFRKANLLNSIFAVYERYLADNSNSNTGTVHNTRRVLSHINKYWENDRIANKPTLTFVNFLETHNPHTVVQSSAAELDLEFSDEEIENLNKEDDDHEYLFGQDPVRDPFDSWDQLYQRKCDAYHTGIHNFDTLFKDFISGQDENELSDKLIILTGDHGEMFGEEEMVGHQTSLHPAGIQVPLFVKFPDSWGEADSTINDPVSWLGLSRTLRSVVNQNISDTKSFYDKLIRNSRNPDTDSLVCIVDGPNWNIDKLKRQYDEGAVSDMLEIRRIGLIKSDKMTVYSSKWDSDEIWEQQYRLDDYDRILVKEQKADPDIKRFAHWLGTNDQDTVSGEVSQRLEDLGYV